MIEVEKSTLGIIEEMICTRAKTRMPLEDNLTGYYYSKLPVGTKKNENFRAFYHFFDHIETAFGVLLPLGVWDRDWKISQFSIYIDKLVGQPGRSLAVGRKRLEEEYDAVNSAALAIWLFLSISLLAIRYTAPVGLVSTLLFMFVLQKKGRRIFRLKKLIRVNEQRAHERNSRLKSKRAT